MCSTTTKRFANYNPITGPTIIPDNPITIMDFKLDHELVKSLDHRGPWPIKLALTTGKWPLQLQLIIPTTIGSMANEQILLTLIPCYRATITLTPNILNPENPSLVLPP